MAERLPALEIEIEKFLGDLLDQYKSLARAY
jgi:hypothetical protein